MEGEPAMSGHGLIWFLVVGLVAGWLAGKIMKGSGYGLVGDLVVGILGAFIGGWVFGLLGISTWGLIGSLVVALAGALLLLYLIRLVKKG
ncbi:MAG TPA: GlsB/YeaQ/YmgE family stress response membrane protein [Gemmatimonadales bacterium]|nr:GlsB/YeaQ/YmgE family stress response membrane protein [Gemmatimonadales bacterium]